MNNALRTANKSAAKFLSARVVAVRAELSDLQEVVDAGMHKASARAMIRSLKRDLLDLECRLAEVVS